MLFSKYIAVLALPVLAVATPWGTPTTKPVTTTVTITQTATATSINQCNVSSLQCCDSTASANSTPVTTLLGLLGVVLDDLDVLVGLTCSPISVVGILGGECTASPLCCEDNNFGGLISIGCVPIIL